MNTQDVLRLQICACISLFFALILTSCGWRDRSAPSMLVVAVEYLGFDSFSCGTQETVSLRDFSGFHVFCEESVRFTHAYTSSIMSQAAIASILTGRYPFEHGVWHNGFQYLSAHFKTIQEVAIEKKYRTSFFSGGPPIWRKSGFAQGFEVFEDNVNPTASQPYRPVEENFGGFLNWLKKESLHEPFFSFIYVPDLQFPGVATKNDFGEIREKSSSGQLREVGESLGTLISDLRALGRWDSTTVILVGLNGRSKLQRPGEFEAYDLHSEASQVALYIKPARRKRDLGLEWKIDKNVSLVDVGATLFDFFGKSLAPSGEERLPVVSLLGALDRPQVSWDQDRLILVESGWPQWRGVGGSRFSLRRGHYLLLYDEKVKVFNTLIDRQEISPLSESDQIFRSISTEIMLSLQNKAFMPWSFPPQLLLEKLQIGKVLWLEDKKSESLIKKLVGLTRAAPWDQQLWGWKALIALREKNWKWLTVLGERNNKETWKYVGQKNLGRPFRLSSHGCQSIFLWGTKRYQRPRPHECEDELLMSLLRWIEERNFGSKQLAREQFARLFRQNLTDRRIAGWNYVNSLKWDVNIAEPSEPSLAELFLSLPENQKYSKMVDQILHGEDPL